ncbi:peptide/nickel transport system permease protein [Arthrobacter ginsengisoli]|uniref:Peptide/nickel transport system permease protein n=1 Tax=Arthrobacter ginsengisoli TaxID=1356565 RepID=A0ABU1UG58_9MICC|nr:ABC transporter permease [Arthrobacter ginsengisoli]MDR7084181.1 peptide/nickel transport system permease protein [Arthrobacter ginsengisoli]
MTVSSIAEASRAPGVRAGSAGSRYLRHPWVGFSLRRLGGLLLSFAVLVMVTFLIVPLIPGDPAVIAAGEGASPAQIANVRAELGLDLPLYTQFFNYVSGVLRLDMGASFVSGESVSTLIFTRFPFTAEIALLAILLALAIAVPLGMTVAILTRGGRNRWLDAGFNFLTGLIYSVPQYVVATLLVVVFAVTLRWFPAAGAATLNSLVLPTAALMLGPACVISRIVRRETAAVLDKDYIRTARGWRLGVLRTNARYVLPNLVTTTLTLSGLILAAQLGGAVVIETVFAWPGLGQGIVNAILQRDYPVIRGIILVLGLLATLIIILVDLILAIIDPRTLGGTSHDI